MVVDVDGASRHVQLRHGSLAKQRRVGQQGDGARGRKRFQERSPVSHRQLRESD
jgi:hypothetical protein